MLEDQLYDLLNPVVDDLGFILWGIECFGANHNLTVRVYIDHENGIGIEDCETVSRAISALLDVEDPIEGHYTLEVSSPGADRRIFNSAQAASVIGFEVSIKFATMIQGQRKAKGTISHVDNDNVTLILKGQPDATLTFDFADVERMKVVPTI